MAIALSCVALRADSYCELELSQDSAATSVDNPLPDGNPAVRRDNAACFSDSEDLKKYLGNQATRIVDVRPPEKFARAHIEGSLNIPLHLVATRQFLQSSPLILVGGDGEMERILRLCTELRRQRGQKVWVEKTGIGADWAKRMLVGSHVKDIWPAELTSRELLESLHSFNWTIMFLADEGVPSEVAELGTVIPPSKLGAELPKRLKALDPQIDRVLLVDGRGNQTVAIDSYLDEVDPQAIRTLKGGLNEFQQLLTLRNGVNYRRLGSTAAAKSCANASRSAG